MRQQFLGVSTYKNSSILNYIILDTIRNQVNEYNEFETVKIIKNEGIEGLILDKRSILGSNGSVDNYTRLKDEKLVSHNKLVILSEVYYNNKLCGYDVCDYIGRITRVSKNYIVYYIKEQGIANGILEELNGQYTIKPFQGQYKKVQITTGNKIDWKVFKSETHINIEDTKGNIVYTIEHEGGFIRGYNTDKAFWVDMIKIKDDYRQRGIASQLYKMLEEYIIENKLGNKILTGVNDYIASNLFYNQGFKVLEYMNDMVDEPESAIMYKQLN